MEPIVTIIENGRDGDVRYAEGALRAINGYWEFGGNDVVTIVSMGSRMEWERSQAWALERRAAILRFVADEVIRQRAPTCSAEIDEESGIIRDAFAGMWTALPDGQLISLYLLEQAGEYNLYSAPVKLNGRETNLRVLYDWDKEAFRVIGGWDGLDENGASGKEIIKIKPGDSIVPLYEAYNEEGEYLGLDEGEVYSAEDGFTIEYMQLPAAGYYYSFTLTDLFGLETYTDFALFEVDEQGEIWFDAE